MRNVVYVVAVDKEQRTALCPCNEVIALPNVADAPMLRAEGMVWFPLLIAVQCPKCNAEVRLDGTAP